ncbi:MAG TPA: bifunctional 4-hydroxy-2-oxoglutarate aldolase/2-dehydro-3-deoxy-phosphogluconate aldolase, partial [Candidatus Binatia bacterium]|nr:bifunctional 4-hydroxy-2-oxoglutarate aldolase/2-dehydro-3-deoxy-phosphogluconate aldolase [Candidatus Binatia bacterium]
MRSQSADQAIELAQLAAQGGVRFVEITFSVPGALDVIRELAREKKVHVGAGTVLTPQQAERAIDAGAEFVVSPSLELNLVGICHASDIACFPGAA